ncbi:MAG: DNA-3-methyladenine glycosylase [Solirubrobacteraceae bacterium]|nr:DNA-3-methyladenine glycosylase [Solirubrobacteraceae bacterium]
MDQAIAALRAADPVLAGLIDAVGATPPEPRPDRPPPGEHYAALVRTITGQQLSVRAARAIWTKLLAAFDDRPPTPAEVLDADPEELRAAAGLSRAKVSYLRSLAEHVETGELELDRLEELSDSEVISELTAIRGLGEWSAHMFLMFQLERPDVLAAGDLGIRRAVQLAYDLPALPAPAELEALGERWRPYRTTACRVLWRSLEATPQ